VKESEQKAAAAQFATKWAGRGYEKGETQTFWLELLQQVYAELYHFGVLQSNVNMAWLRAVCGRLKSDYNYSKNIVYNNFPWPTPTDKQRAAIEQTAQGILDARALYPNDSLADFYDATSMPPELRKAHQANDRAVMAAYGFDVKTTSEAACVAELMRRYQKLTAKGEK